MIGHSFGRTVIALGILLGAAVARAEPPPSPPPASRADAAASFREARAAFTRGDFAAAAAAFEQAARAAPHPATWLNAAEAWAKRDDWSRAAEDCDRALDVPDGDPAIRREAETRLQVALVHVATLEARFTPPRAWGARIDGATIQPLPVRRRLVPGRHEVILVDLASGREETRLVSIAAGQTVVVDAPPSAPEPRTAPAGETNAAASAASSNAPPPGALVALGIGGAAGIATAVVGFMTLGAKRDFEDHPTQGDLDDFHRDRLVTNVLLGVSVVAVAAGIAWWVLSPKSHRTMVEF